MKIEKLTDNKIRIILNIDELTEKNIDFLSLTKNTNETQKLFKKILKQAEKEVDFNTENCKLLIEAFISSDGFFIITFTKITPEEDVKVGNSLKLKVKKGKTIPVTHNAIYEFNNFEDFSELCTYLGNSNLNNIKKIAKNVSLFEYENKFFLVFTNINVNYRYISLLYSLLSEFSTLSSTSTIFISKLFEFGKPILKKDALNIGIKYFKNPV